MISHLSPVQGGHTEDVGTDRTDRLQNLSTDQYSDFRGKIYFFDHLKGRQQKTIQPTDILGKKPFYAVLFNYYDF